VDKINYKKRPNPLTPFPCREGGKLPSPGRRGVGGEVLQVIVPNYLNGAARVLPILPKVLDLPIDPTAASIPEVSTNPVYARAGMLAKPLVEKARWHF